MAEITLVMYSRTRPCPFVSTARRVLDSLEIPYKEIMIDEDEVAYERVVNWTGFASVPTLIVAKPGSLFPIEVPPPLERGESPRGINRGFMITEPSDSQLLAWLKQHRFI